MFQLLILHNRTDPGATLLKPDTDSLIPGSLKYWVEQQFAFHCKHCLRGIKSSFIYPAMQIKPGSTVVKENASKLEITQMTVSARSHVVTCCKTLEERNQNLSIVSARHQLLSGS